MADQRITQLGQKSIKPADDDLLVMVDVDDTTMAASGTNKKITMAFFATTTGDAASITGGGEIVLGGNELTVGKSCAVAGEDTTNGFLAAQTFYGNVIFSPGTATISGGTVTPTAGLMVIDTQAGAATDYLDTITAGENGQMLILKTAASTRDVVVKHGTDNIYLAGGADFTLDNIRCTLTLMFYGTEWREVSHSHNHA